MVYDRFAGIKSLPGPDGKMPRPFRVDEDGNVIYLDEERNTARPEGERNAGEHRRAGIMSWDELDRRYEEELAAIRRLGDERPVQLAELGNSGWNGYEAMQVQGQRDGRTLRHAVGRYAAGDQQGSAIGATSRTARVLGKTADVRDRYIADVRKLDRFDSDGRAALKEYWRGPMPPETRSILNKARPGYGGRVGSVGRANITNPGVDDAIRVTRRISRGAGLAGAGLAAADIATAENPWRATAANVGAVIGGVGGGAGGAFLGGLTGPGAFVAAPTLGAAGSIGGGQIGYELGEDIYDFIRRYFR